MPVLAKRETSPLVQTNYK